jgi:lipid II:glycine glycyltransferase (peptidoglycan interpeptide bridge formation enzyme)
MLKLAKQSEYSAQLWSDFVENHPQGNIFQTPDMYEIYLRAKNYEPIIIIATDDKNDIVGVLLAVIQKEHSGILGYFSTRSIIWGGPLLKENDIFILDFILKEYRKLIKGKAIYTQFRNLWDWNGKEKQTFIKNGFRFKEHLDILIDLNKSEDVLLMEMHAGRRKNIRRAERVPLDFSVTEDDREFEKCLNLIEQTYKKVKLPCPDRSFFYNADNILGGKWGIKKFVIKYHSGIIGCRFVLCYKDLVYDWFAGTDENHLDKYPNDFLPWKIIQWTKMKGYSTFDFGGAGKPGIPYGVRDYKLKFGGKLVNFGRFEVIHNNILFNIGKFALKIYKLVNINTTLLN